MEDAQSEYTRWVKPIEQQMMRTIWRIVRDPDEAEDALQQALEKAWRQWSRVRRHPNPPALIMTIAVNAAYDQLRRRARRARREPNTALPELHASPAAGADQQLAGAEAQAAIYQAIEQLPTQQRLTVSLRLLADLSYDAIAQTLGCSEATARTHFMRALQTLRKKLASLAPGAGQEAGS
jgi:RNA polymerase sigma factor (sigma-70 family)